MFDFIVDGSPQAYADWAADYFEGDVDEGAVAAILAGKPLTPELVRSLRQTTNFDAIASEATSMGYPVAQP
ncbi:hypothetical protein [Actinoplanes aureus]|uniref:Uncharacterized protein n=1 Tax=Actinoplanes aureus TaxID=2792083 RepID=A0A931G7Y0_9ACTN|nr:hypothetical protein [Actinoplanes aureus]MBG0568709.1 hypothetical protein [Actinoplanes aureus]